MCGIWLYTQLINSHNHHELKKASDEINKRGPDKSIDTYITFGNFEILMTFHRLSIMDLSSAGDQPFIIDSTKNKNEKIYLMCNGEIYGFEILVKEFHLEDLLKSHSDCEMLIYLYQILGLQGLYNILTTRPLHI